MKFSAVEEYGLRCLIQIAKNGKVNGITIPELSELEGLSEANVAKILRILRLGGIVEAERGQTGGYRLTRPPEQITLREILYVLGGKLFENDYCNTYTGITTICTNSTDCSVRSVWKNVQRVIDEVLGRLTLKDLLAPEKVVDKVVSEKVENVVSTIELKVLQ
ncbi:MAG: Rrf2 family transcriptional regulator [Ignavibacteria bacterium]|jgi:Rrf2 family protein|nr:Rrf2 family transcriptional regulator [Ignavibacteria bacterium]MDH7526739.1 Rrf2 family transcriptional regulator [Ignavibacteria bacterium]